MSPYTTAAREHRRRRSPRSGDTGRSVRPDRASYPLVPPEDVAGDGPLDRREEAAMEAQERDGHPLLRAGGQAHRRATDPAEADDAVEGVERELGERLALAPHDQGEAASREIRALGGHVQGIE